MKVISANIGEARTIEWNGQKVQTGIYKYPVDSPISLGAEDVVNDHVMDRKHHGGIDKACYSYSSDHYKHWKKLYPELEIYWGMFGENLTVENLEEAKICIGDTFQLGDTVVQVTQPRQPCFKLGVRFENPMVVKQFVESGFPGIYFRVLKKGQVKKGDELIPLELTHSVSVQKVFELLYTSDFQQEETTIALENKWLAESCRKDLLKRWGNCV